MLQKCEQSGQGRRGTSPGEVCPGISASARVPGIYTHGQAGKLELEAGAGLYTHAKRAGN